MVDHSDMANTLIQIKRSSATSIPSTLSAAEPAYSYQSNTIFIGTSDGSGVLPVGGYAYINKINAAFAKANNALSNTSGSTFSDNLIITGNVGIGTTNSSIYTLNVAGSISSSNTVVALHFDTVSDSTMKENVCILYNSYDKIDQLNPVSFIWKGTDQKSFGLIAQDVEKIIPEIVHTNGDSLKTVSYIQLIPFIISVIKDQQKQINDLNKRLNI